jgi:hypothetical protein
MWTVLCDWGIGRCGESWLVGVGLRIWVWLCVPTELGMVEKVEGGREIG